MQPVWCKINVSIFLLILMYWREFRLIDIIFTRINFSYTIVVCLAINWWSPQSQIIILLFNIELLMWFVRNECFTLVKLLFFYPGFSLRENTAIDNLKTHKLKLDLIEPHILLGKCFPRTVYEFPLLARKCFLS